MFTILFFASAKTLLAGDSIPDQVLVTYTSINKNLPQVLEDLVALSGVNIIYSEAKLNKTRKVKIQVRKEKLGTVLKLILAPFRMDYELIGDNIVIINKRSEDYKAEIVFNGYIRDKATGETLPYATLYDDDSELGVSANENGFFSIKIPRKEYKFKVSFVGYETVKLEGFFGEDKFKVVELENINTLNEVIITESNNKESSNLIGIENYDKSHLNHATFLGGESDVFRLVGMSSGVSSGADGFGGLSVRGGSYDQNLILLDGVPLHHTGHALGLISVFNSSTIQDAKLYKSGFPSKYGGKLSSILDIRTREGNYKKIGGEVSLSTLASKISLEGPILKDKASFLVSYRRTFADLWIKSLSSYQYDLNQDEGEASYKFSDLNAKVNFKLGKSNTLILSYFNADDKFSNLKDSKKTVEGIRFEDINRENLGWGSNLFSIHLNSQLSKKAFSRLIGYRSNWDYKSYDFDSYNIIREQSISEIYNASLEGSNIENIGARYEVDYMANNKYTLRTGIASIFQKFNPQAAYLNNIKDEFIYPNIINQATLESIASKINISSEEYQFFIDNEIKFGNTILNLGLHNSYYKVGDKSYLSIQPRISYLVNGDFSSVKFAATKMTQYNQVLSNNQLGFPSDLWITSTDLLRPADGWTYSIGSLLNIDKTFDINVEGYYKIMNGLISLNEGENVPFNDPDKEWERTVARGRGTAYGAEIDLLKRFGETNFNFNYTYSRSNRDFEDLNNGIIFDYKYDRRHMFNGNIIRSLGKKADISLNIVYGKGNPVTIPTSEITEVTNIDGKKFLSIVYSEKNGSNFRDYLRVDIGFNFYTEYSFGKQKFSLGVYNLLNNTNPLYYDVRRNNFDPNVYELHSISILPILPSINYSLTF